MFAVIETGGKQYRVREGDLLDVELDARGGDDDREIEFDRVLMIGGGDSVQVGRPILEGAKVTGSLVQQVRGPKIKVFKKKRRKGYKRLRGHRQNVLRVRIGSISA
ncbi:MAG TPA: 50S ribosomal protein L21 [Thermoanaerobaculia bacterium]|nr:50S ribosomal protein L21 [Thermoanaerobaculia bacterium]